MVILSRTANLEQTPGHTVSWETWHLHAPRPPQEEWGHDLLTDGKQISEEPEDGQDGLPVWGALQWKQIATFKKKGEGTANYGEPYGGFLKN